MKKILLPLLLLFVTTIQAQKNQSNKFGHQSGDTMYMNNGAVFVKKQQINFGMGSNGFKGFEFIFTSPLSIAGQQNLPNNWAHMSMVVKDFKFYSSKRTGDKIYIILGGGNIVNYWCDIYSAMDAGEVIVAGINDKKTLSSAGAPRVDVADELAKLNKLYKDSILTKEEYEAQKKKILSQ